MIPALVALLALQNLHTEARGTPSIGYKCPATPAAGVKLNAEPFAVHPLDPEAADGDPLQWCCGVCMASLILGGCEPACCTAWTYDRTVQTCSLFADWRSLSSPGHDGLTTGLLPSAAPRDPPAPPAPAKEGSQKNIIVVLTDDQDLRLNSMQAMPHAQRLLNHAGANLTNFWVNTPVSRSACTRAS